MSDFRIELLDKIAHIQERLRLITCIYTNQMELLLQRFSDDYEDLERQLVQLKETIRQLDSDRQ
ncbi:MAG TPA: hypothetical protein DCP31_02555 [Cyanobacteria bacterium UBA8543]|nr:hypothetical protein [Cyanobacteria bacterium UBA8543]